MKQSTQQVLLKYFEKKKRAAKGFSVRSLAKKLELSPSFLSRVLNGQRPVSYPLLVKLGRLLDIDPETMTGLKNAHSQTVEDAAVPRRGRAQVESTTGDWELTESFNVLRQWFYLPILEFTTLENFDGSLEKISSRLGISKTSTEIATRELLSLGLLKELDGRLKKSSKKLRWSTSTKHLADVRKYHGQMLKKAHEMLVSQTSDEDFARRLITGITVTASEKSIKAAKQKLSECLHEIANDLAAEEGSDVYQLSAQLFPLTKPER
jgi:uncharacterized protein (TIGR02147 family)